MGLDMYAYTMDTKPEKETDFTEPDTSNEWQLWAAADYDQSKEPYLHYWRKHPNLHGWMERLYYEKGGQDAEFVGPVHLTLEDLARLENALLVHELPETSGFFFGESSPGCREELPDDLVFSEKARKAISEGKYVYYTSSW